MKAYTMNALALLCIILWTKHGTTGQQFASDQTLKDYGSLTTGLGTLIGGVGKDDQPDIRGIDKSLNRMASMMQGITEPNGAPPFTDEKLFKEIEQVFTRMGPYVCLLPRSTPKNANDLPPVLGGMIGGLIGAKVGEERLRKRKDYESMLSLMSGVGTIAGALGGMSGWEVTRGRFGRPNTKRIVEMVPEFVKKMGDMKSMLKGSFQPLSDTQHKNLKLLVERDLGRATRKLSKFFNSAKDCFKGNQTDATVEAKSDAFNQRFRAVDSELAKIGKSVSSMAGVYGGIVGYIMPRFHEERRGAPDKGGEKASNGGKKPLSNGTENSDHTKDEKVLRENVTDVKGSLKKMRAFKTDSKVRGKSDKWDLFGGALNDIADSAGEVGGYSGVIGGMLAEVVANGAVAQVGKFLPWKLKKEEDDDDEKGPRISKEEILQKLTGVLPFDGIERLDSNQKLCVQSVVVGLEHFGRLHKFGDNLPGALQFKGPYGSELDSVSNQGVRKHLLDSQWNGDWNQPLMKKSLVDGVSIKDLAAVVQEVDLENNGFIEFVNQIVKEEGTDSKVIKLLTGKLAFKNASKDEVQALNAAALAALKPTVVSNMTASNFIDIFRSEMRGRNPALFKKFLMGATDDQMNNVLTKVKELKENKEWYIYSGTASIIADHLVDRFGPEAHSELCPFASGISPSVIKRAKPGVFMDTDLLTCMRDFKDDLPEPVKEAIVEKAFKTKNVSVEIVDSLKGFTDIFDSKLWYIMEVDQIEELINSGHFLALKDMCPIKRRDIMDALKSRLNISSSVPESTKYLRNLGEVICGIPVSDLEKTVPEADLEDVKTNYTRDCITEPNTRRKESEKSCAKNWGVAKGKCKKIRQKMLQSHKKRLDSYKWTRSTVKKGLSQLSGELPLAIQDSLEGLTISEISNIPDGVLDNSLTVVSENMKLTFPQRRKILKKIIDSGQKLDTADELEEIGGLLSAVDVMNVKANLTNKVLTERPNLLMKFPKVKKIRLMNKLFDELSTEAMINAKTPLSYLIPTYKLRELSSLNMEAIERMRWTVSQGLEIVDRYKTLNQKPDLDMKDIRKLGMASVGITCQDVSKLPLSSMVYLARFIDHVAGNDISPSLASCIATKLYLCLKMKCIKGPNINELISKTVPGNILIFLPPSILAHVSYGKDCVSLIRKLGKANIDLLSPGPGSLAIGGMLQVAQICGDSLEDKGEMGDRKDAVNKTASEKMNKTHDEKKEQPEKETGSNKLNKEPLPSRIRRNPGKPSDQKEKMSDDRKPKPGNSSDNDGQDDEMRKTQPKRNSGEDVITLGRLACSLEKFNKTPPHAMAQFSRVLPTCIGSITEERKEEINAMFKNNIKKFEGDYINLRPMLGSILPLIDPDFIETNISSTVAAILMQNIRPMQQNQRERKQIVGDKSSSTISFTENLGIETPNGTLEFDLDYNPINMRAFADTIFPKLVDYIKTKNKTGKDPAAPVSKKPPKKKAPSDDEEQQYSRKRRQAESNDTATENSTTSTTTTTTPSSTESNEESNNDASDDMEAFPENGITYELLMLAGPAIIGLKVEDIDGMSDKLFKDSLPLMGRYRGWSEPQLDAIESKMSVYGKSATWSSALLQDLGHLSVMLDDTSIQSMENIDMESLGPLSRVAWPSNDLRLALLQRYSELRNKEVSDLTGAEIMAAGDLICGIEKSTIPNLGNTEVKFAFSSLGKIRCFSEEQLLAFKDKMLTALNQEITVPSVLHELGILGGAMTVQQFQSIPPFMASLVSSDALRVVAANKIIDGWNESHFALMGVENGAAIIARRDIFKSLSDKSKNAVFRAAFGSDAGIVSTLIDLMKHGKERSSAAFKNMLHKMLGSVAMLFNIMVPSDKAIPRKGGPGSVYGLVDPASFVKPPPPDFAVGLSQKDFTKAFSTKFLEDYRVINFINKAAKGADKILEVMKGTKSFNDLADDEIKAVPPTVFVGLKVNQLREMSPKVVGSMFDSPRAARDPTSMTKVIRRLDISQFEDAMDLMNKKMKETIGGGAPRKPPIKTQEAMAKDYLNRLSNNKSVSDVEIMNKFIENICSIVAGIPPWMFKKIPMVDSKKKEALECMEKSYKDLSLVQKKQITKWALQSPTTAKGRTENANKKLPSLQDVKDLGVFMLDIPVHQVRKALSEPASALELVENGNMEKLDTLHPNYEKLSKMTVRKLVKDNKDQFNDKAFLKKLGASKCEIPLKRVKKSMDKDTIKYLANYTMSQCKQKETLLDESMKECEGDQAMRLQRCQLLQKEVGETLKSKSKFSEGTQQKKKRVSLDQFNMMRELADSLLAEFDLSKINGDEIKNVAGALGGLNPMDMDKLPDSSVLEAMDSIKDNLNLSPKQKKIMFRKAKKAGFSLDGESSLADLGELVSEVPVAEFLKISPENMKKSLKGLMKKAREFSPSQKRAIVGRLRNISMEEMLDDDLGAFAAEIPLKKLKSLRSVNLTLLKDQPWERDQAAELIDIYLNSTDDGTVDVDTISEMGSTALGLKCSHIMDMEYYEAQETATLINNQADMDPDMNECMQSKLHFSNQVELGEDYMTNDTDEADLETTLEAIPDNVALFYEPEVVNATPDALCDKIYQKIGEAQLSSLPPGPGDERRKELAEGAVYCLERDPDREFTVLEEEDVEMLGGLICDVPAENYKNMPLDAFDTALENMKNCLQWFTEDHVSELKTLIKTHNGEVATWDETTLASLGPLVGFLTEEDIESIDDESFADSFDEITPPDIDPDSAAYSLMNYDAFYSKARESLGEADEHDDHKRRKRGAAKPPTYDEIVALGPGNSGWSVDELDHISDNDIIAALDVLGSVEDWSSAQREILIERLEAAKSQKKKEWSSSDIADAKHILTGLTPAEISTLDIGSIETTTSLSDVAWSSEQRTAALDVFMSKTSKTPETLTSEDIAGLGTLLCGMDSVKLSTITVSVVSDALKDMGELTCYNQEQLDALYSLVYQSNEEEFPDGALLSAMGSIAAGMTTEELQEIEVEDMPMLSVYAIKLMSPLRFKEGMSTTQLSAAGVTNLAAVIRNKQVYEALSVEQRNVVNTAAYGRSAVIEEVPETEAISEGSVTKAGGAVDVTTTTEKVHGHSDENRSGDTDGKSTTTEKVTTTSGAPFLNVNYCVFVVSSLFVYFLL